MEKGLGVDEVRHGRSLTRSREKKKNRKRPGCPLPSPQVRNTSTTKGSRYLVVNRFRRVAPMLRKENDCYRTLSTKPGQEHVSPNRFLLAEGRSGVAKESVRHNLIRVMRLQRSPIQSIICPQPVRLVQFMLEGLLPVALVLLSMLVTLLLVPRIEALQRL